MHMNEHGFSAVEGLLIFTIVGIIGIVGWFVYSSNNNVNTALNNAANVQNNLSKTTKKPVIPSGWLSYKSKNSTITFSYPSDWTLKSTDNAGISYNLEGVTIAGPNSFSLRFDLEKVHPNSAMCVTGNQNTATVLANKYYLSVENLSRMFLSLKDTSGTTSCSLSFPTSLNLIDKNTGFIFEGSYGGGTSKPSGVYTVDDFLKKPEAQTAKKIFESFAK
jgi:hypothetical protein